MIAQENKIRMLVSTGCFSGVHQPGHPRIQTLPGRPSRRRSHSITMAHTIHIDEVDQGQIRFFIFQGINRAGRDKIVTLVNSFHGRTVTTLAATGQDVFHNFFYPFTEGFVYAQANSFEALEKACDDKVCAVMIEFVQGEGGVVPLDEAYVKAVAKFCAEHDLLLIADEVQTGIGRTGTLLASEQFGVHPDITTLAKGLGGGLPIGAVLVDERLENVMGASSHGSTFGGNPVVCAGANVVLSKLDDALLADIRRKGDKIRAALNKCKEVESVTGLGMMIGIALKTKTAADVREACMQAGLLVLTAKTKVRLLPPLTISDEDLDKGLEILCSVVDQ